MVQNTNDKVNEEVPNTEVIAKAKRRHFTGAEKQLSCGKWKPVGDGRDRRLAEPRRNLFILSHDLAQRTREQRIRWIGTEEKRGPKPNPEAIELAKLRREYARLQERMRQAELIIHVQKKVARMLGANLEAPNLDDPN